MARTYYAAERADGPWYDPRYSGIHAFVRRVDRDGWIALDGDGEHVALPASEARRAATREGSISLHGDAMVPYSWDTRRAWWYDGGSLRSYSGVAVATLQTFES